LSYVALISPQTQFPVALCAGGIGSELRGSMYPNPAANWYYNSRLSTPELCAHCGRILRHERWCITRDPLVRYAYDVVGNPEKLTLTDRLILHALGVDWGCIPCEGAFRQMAEV